MFLLLVRNTGNLTNFITISFSLLIRLHHKMHELLHECAKLKVLEKQQILTFHVFKKRFEQLLLIAISSYILLWSLILHFSKRKRSKCYGKSFLFHVNRSFGSWDTQFFVIFPCFVLHVKISKGISKWNKYFDRKWIVLISNFNFWNNS